MNTVSWAVSALELPAGKTELTDFRYPVYLFGPREFKASSHAAMVLVLAGEKDLEETLKEWSPAAEQHKMMVVVPEIRMRDEDVPYKTDQWLIKMKNDLAVRYGIRRIYLVGHGAKAHYASYLGLKYPEEFTAVGAISGSWVGGFEKLVKPSIKQRKQIPFFIALDQKHPSVTKTQKRTEDFTKKGYTIRLAMLEQPGEEAGDKLKSDILTWFEGEVEKNIALRQAMRLSFKQKANKVVEEFFEV